jgi:pimeloyl-ACP methyl ester carboxylesterase
VLALATLSLAADAVPAAAVYLAPDLQGGSRMSTQFLVRPQGRIAYEETGAGSLVVLVPGIGDLRGEYRFLAPRLAAAGYRVVSMDLRGLGESSPGWDDYSAAAVGSDVVALLRELDAGPAHLVGTSMAAGAVAWAAALADAEGLDQLTLAGVAERLGIRTPSLYNHVPGLEGLRRELTLLGLRELARRMGHAAMGRAGDEALVAIAHAYRDFALQHPGVCAATLRVADPDDAELVSASDDVLRVVLAVLSSYGLTGDAALHAVRGLRSLLHGFVALEAAGGFGLPLDLDESFGRLVRAFMAGLRALP